MLTGNRVQRNVQGMLDFFQMKFEGNEHRGIDDAYNTANIYIKLLSAICSTSKLRIDAGYWGDDFYENNS